MLQSHVSELAGELAARLCASAGGRLTKTYFGSSGSEGVDTAIKFARAFTGRNAILYAQGGFHGLTCSSLSLMSNPFWHGRFGPMLPDTDGVPFGDPTALEDKLRTRRYAAFIVEPVQAENGVSMNAEFLRQAELLCRRYDTLFVLDEVQTGVYRTGAFLAAHRFKLNPDMVILAKALSGGLIPCGAVLMTDAICEAIYDSLDHAFIHTSTFSENSLAMRAALATLDVLEAEQLGENAERMGNYLRQQLHEALGEYEMIGTIHGIGLLNGISFKSPTSWRFRLPYEGFRKFHPGLFGQIFVMRLFNKGNMLTQICGNDFMTLKVAPPLSVTRSEIDEFVQAIRRTVDEVHHSAGFWSEGLKIFARAGKVSWP
jgi:ornithine--oxo-acid transaminase